MRIEQSVQLLNDGKMLGNDGEMLVNDGERLVNDVYMIILVLSFQYH